MRALLALRALFFLALLPGTVTGYVPYRILQASGELRTPRVSLSALSPAVLVIVGAAVLLRCVWDFFAAGHGTLAPIDPPKQLVVQGLYRFTRNPMYNGILAILAGQASLFQSTQLVWYAFSVAAGFHLFVVLYEERTLESRFGGSYRAYRHSVPRWGFTLHPFQAKTGSTA